MFNFRLRSVCMELGCSNCLIPKVSWEKLQAVHDPVTVYMFALFSNVKSILNQIDNLFIYRNVIHFNMWNIYAIVYLYFLLLLIFVNFHLFLVSKWKQNDRKRKLASHRSQVQHINLLKNKTKIHFKLGFNEEHSSHNAK